MQPPSLTLGIEEEYQIVDPASRELRSYITEILEGDHVTIAEIQPELHQSVVEVGSTVCRTPAQLREEVVRLRRTVMELVAERGLRIVAAGTHPFSSWMDQEITPLERYLGVQEDLQDLARKNLIFGMHVHVGIEDREFLVDAMTVARYFLPHVLALSTSSPFWMGRNTGLKSYRSVIWRNFPRTGLPPAFETWADYEQTVSALVRMGAIEEGSKLWWDLRPHWRYQTLEFRVCDICTRVEEAVCLAALLQAIVAKLWKLRRDNLTFRVYPELMIAENKWRAVRYGLDGELLDLGKGKAAPARHLIQELVGWFVDDVVDELGSRAEVEYALRILEEGTSADRQLAVWRDTGDTRAVVDHLIRETAEGVDPGG
ncbi:MAG: carboxylate-amine ligase [Gemmatimonadota bacterium]|jgi:carboxylate-amine ligase